MSYYYRQQMEMKIDVELSFGIHGIKWKKYLIGLG